LSIMETGVVEVKMKRIIEKQEDAAKMDKNEE
jgi:hypothetical protein